MCSDRYDLHDRELAPPFGEGDSDTSEDFIGDQILDQATLSNRVVKTLEFPVRLLKDKEVATFGFGVSCHCSVGVILVLLLDRECDLNALLHGDSSSNSIGSGILPSLCVNSKCQYLTMIRRGSLVEMQQKYLLSYTVRWECVLVVSGK